MKNKYYSCIEKFVQVLFYDLGFKPLLTIKETVLLWSKVRKFCSTCASFVKTFSIFVISDLFHSLYSDVTPNVANLWDFKYAYLGQVAYEHGVIGVAVKGCSMSRFNMRIGHNN